MSGQLHAPAAIPSQKAPLPPPPHSCATWMRVCLGFTAGPTALQEKLPYTSRELNSAVYLLYTMRYTGTKKPGQLNRIVAWLRAERKGSRAEFSDGARDCFPSQCEIRSFPAVKLAGTWEWSVTPFNAAVKNEWSYPSAPPYVFMTFTGTASLLPQSNRITKRYAEGHIWIWRRRRNKMTVWTSGCGK
jgi:hypothetical protein